MRWNPLGVTTEKTFEFIFNNMTFLFQGKYEITPNLKDQLQMFHNPTAHDDWESPHPSHDANNH